jgi:hypothetical protein
MKQIVFILTICFFIIGCAVKKPELKGYINFKGDRTTQYSIIEKFSKECYQKDATLFSDGILIKSKNNNEFGQITFHRHAFDIGVVPPFIIITIENNKIKVIEGPYNCDFSGCTTFNIKKQISRWIKGNTSCQ